MIRKGISGLIMMLALLVMCCSNSKDNPKPIETKKKLTVLTYNIHHGAPADSETINLSNIAAVIKQSNADIVALQEVDVNTERSGNVNQAKVLAEMLNMEYHFSKSIDYRGGDYGNAILSKYPLSNKRSLLLPMPVPKERRSIALATVTLPDGKKIEFGSTHFDVEANRMDQSAFLVDLSKELVQPLIIGGDYNATPDSPEMIELKKEFALSCMGSCPFTIPVTNPNKAIDFVVFNQKARQMFSLVSGIAMKGQYASDHLPVIAVFQYN